jgi:nucleotide-binding universal stress UspA family protein
MTDQRRPGRVVAATSGTPASRAAVAYAARRARESGVPLELVHVVPAYFPVGPLPTVPDVQVRRTAQDVLDRACDLAEETVPGLTVTTHLVMGSRVDALVRHSEDAALLVVGAAPQGMLERVWTGSTVTGIAARSTCPVVVVPTMPPHLAPTGRILVGLKRPRHADRLLESAFAQADQAHAQLVVVHAWHLMSPYDDAITVRAGDPAWTTEQTLLIEERLIDLRMAHPEVEVQVDLVHGQAAYALVTQSTQADLLLISRPAHGGVLHHLGATARAVLRESACPVGVVPPAPVDTDATPVDEHEAARP